jgi:hypothetical protein
VRDEEYSNRVVEDLIKKPNLNRGIMYGVLPWWGGRTKVSILGVCTLTMDSWVIDLVTELVGSVEELKSSTRMIWYATLMER